MDQRRVDGHVERRRPDVGRRKNGRQLRLRHWIEKRDPLDAVGSLAHILQLGARPDQDRLDVPASSSTQATYRVDEVNGAVPHPERAGKYHDCVAGFLDERHVAARRGMKQIDVGAAIRAQHLLARHVRRNDSFTRCDDEVGSCALPITPTAKRLDQRRSIELLLQRTWNIGNSGVHFEHGRCAHAPRGDYPLAAEVVVALHHDVGFDRTRLANDLGGTNETQLPDAERRRHVVPRHAAVCSRG